jgi:FPC/CPF motif-containing protein YcgG
MDSQLADLAFQGLLAPISEKFAAQEFDSLAHLAQKVTADSDFCCISVALNDMSSAILLIGYC